MLILQRRAGESLVIGEDITVSVLSIDGGRVSLAITAPGSIPILRSELLSAADTNREAADEKASPSDLLHALTGGVLTSAHSNSTKKEKGGDCNDGRDR